MDNLLFPSFLFVVSLVIIVLEIFLPSAGLLTVMALASMLASVVLFFSYDPMWGFASVIGAVTLGPATFLIAIKYWHGTWIGKQISPETPHFDHGEAIPDRDELTALVGLEGKVVTPLRPVGMVDIGGRRVECMAEWGVIEPGTAVTVSSVESVQVKVRPLS
jgi:membrane-bound ClpP family serine protease